MRVIAVTALSLPTSKPTRSRLVRAGTELELEGETLERLRDLGAVKPADEADDEDTDVVEEVELPDRPSNGASKETWRSYLVELEEATEELGDLEIPDDATRDTMIQIGDARVAEWNARQ